MSTAALLAAPDAASNPDDPQSASPTAEARAKRRASTGGMGNNRRNRGNRSGFTTGACSAAAAKAATLGLIHGAVPAQVETRLANGQDVTFAVTDGQLQDGVAHAVIVKDAGDDPDATHGAHMTADVRWLPDAAGQIVLRGGPGVGTVTKPGLGLEVGGPAINPVPRQNISDNVRAALGDLLEERGVEVTISVPGGAEMAKKTLNARLGILGGISILGTTGIVRPYSTAAFRASVVQAVQVAANQGNTSVVFTTGGRTEKCAMQCFPALDEACFVQMGDFVKAAFSAAIKHGMRRIIIGAMTGKLTKMAQGLAVTHAWREEVNRDLLADAAAAVGAAPELCEQIRHAETARFAAERLAELGLDVPFHRELATRAIRSLRANHPGDYQLTVQVVSFEGEPIVCVEEHDLPAQTQPQAARPVHSLLGILDDGLNSLSDQARQRLAEGEVVIGAQRTLDLVASVLAEDAERFVMDGALGQVAPRIRAADQAGQPCVVLATGDPLCHGIGALLRRQLPELTLDILPLPSTLQLACARRGVAWQGMQILSIHSQDAGEWHSGSLPGHGLYATVQALNPLRPGARPPLFGVLTSPENSPARLARALITAGFAPYYRLSVFAHLCQSSEQHWLGLSVEDAAGQTFPDPNVVLIEPTGKMPLPLPAFGFEDRDFIQRQPEKGLITKLEARALSLAKLRLRPDAVVWDIGAGSGSVGLEASRLAPQGHVYAIEKNPADAENARANAQRLHASNYTLYEGKAPVWLEQWPDPDAVFIGGSGGELAELIRLCCQRLRPLGRLVMNFVTLENLAVATQTLSALGAEWDVTQLSAARSQPILDMHRLAAQNPVFVVAVDKPSSAPDTEQTATNLI